jgi:hypothetical protein
MSVKLMEVGKEIFSTTTTLPVFETRLIGEKPTA